LSRRAPRKTASRSAFLGRSSAHPGLLAGERLDPHLEAAFLPLVPPDTLNVAIDQKRRRDPTLRPEDATFVRRREEASRARRTDYVGIECGQEPHRARLRPGPHCASEKVRARSLEIHGRDLERFDQPLRLRA